MQDNRESELLRQQVAAIPWYHTIELPGGVRTPGVNPSAQALSLLRLPASLDGLSVLDIGAWDGYYSFEAARRGASRVLATDSFVWQGKAWNGTGRAGFDLARAALGLDEAVEDQTIDVMDLSPQRLGGSFDVVLFLGVLYHLRDPLGALAAVASVCHGLLVLETEVDLDYLPFPAARIYPGAELNDDPTNWFAFNRAALVELLGQAGFEDVSIVHTAPLWKSVVRRVLSRARVPGFPRVGRQSRRIVVHARKAREPSGTLS